MKTSHLPRSRNIPSVVLIKQHFSVPKEADVREATVRELKKLFPDTTAIKGKIVGLTCPSRGIRVTRQSSAERLYREERHYNLYLNKKRRTCENGRGGRDELS